MPVGAFLLVVSVILIYFGVAQRVLDRMRLTDRAALLIVGLILVGSFFNIALIRRPAALVFNVGGGLVPIAVSIWLIATADTAVERIRGTLAALLSGTGVFILGRMVLAGYRAEPEAMFMEPLYLFALVAGVIGYLAGRSRRAAFVGGILGIVLADLAHFLEIHLEGMPGRAWIGGAGAFDAVVLAGLLAVMLAELVGESRERLRGGPAPGKRAPGQASLRGEDLPGATGRREDGHEAQ
jgi:uncharacterized membrane protein